MSEITRVFTVKITVVGKGNYNRGMTEDEKRGLAKDIKKLLDADNVVVTDVQDFVMEDKIYED